MFVGRLVLIIVGTVFSFVSGAAIYTRSQTNEKLDELVKQMSSLVTRLAVLEQIVSDLPPPEWQTRIRMLETRYDMIESKLEKIEQRAHSGLLNDNN